MAIFTFLLSTVLFARAIAAASYEQAYLRNVDTNHRYGYAFYGFWGGIVLLGMIHRLWQQFTTRRAVHKISDNEGHCGGVAARQYPPFVEKLRHWSRVNLTIPAAFGTHHARLLYWCTIPTRLEMLVIVAYWILTIVLCGAGYFYYPTNTPAQPFVGSSSMGSQRWANVSARSSVLAVSNLPILWLFAGRNNIFLWFTGWSFQTFSIFHRHIARVTILLSIGHAAAETHHSLNTQLPTGHSLYSYGMTEDWFIWGIVGTTAFGVFWLTSVSWLRRKFYDLFLLIHIGLGILVIYAIFRHTTKVEGAFNNYLWAVVAVWSFDRFLRLVRMVACNIHVRFSRSPVHIASTTATYDERSDVVHVQIQTSGLALFRPRPGQHLFLYQPFCMKFWENHPFTIGSWIPDMPSPMSDDDSSVPPSPTDYAEKEGIRKTSTPGTLDSESGQIVAGKIITPRSNSSKTLTFWIRPYDGWTRRLRDECIKSPLGVYRPQLLMEGPYGHSEALHIFDTVVFIAGGTGISSIIPYIKDHIRRSYNGDSQITSMRLIWVTRRVDFVKAVYDQELESILLRPDFRMQVFLTGDDADEKMHATTMAGVEFHLGRPNLSDIISGTAKATAVSGWKCAVFACGPANMADDARQAVHTAMKSGGCRNLEYFEDSFGW